MLTGIGIACVAWTLFELVGFARTGVRRPAPRARVRMRPGARRFAAWDQRGRRIVVEDLGRL